MTFSCIFSKCDICYLTYLSGLYIILLETQIDCKKLVAYENRRVARYIFYVMYVILPQIVTENICKF
jgi:hypothetical protein